MGSPDRGSPPIGHEYPSTPNLSVSVSVGVPQGSPISPLFVIYVAPLHAPDGISFSLSYVDDFSLTVASTSYGQNSSKLIAAFDTLTAQGSAISVPFAPENTEVIHWETYRQRSLAPFSPIQLGGQSITPSAKVRWLGFWFDQRRTGAVHFQKRAASAAITLRSLHTLSSPAKGLTPQNVRHLVQLVLRPRLLYGESILSPREVDLRPMRVVWHSAAQWILGAFRTTPTTSLLVEAGLPPIHLLFKHARLRYALCIACASPTTNPAAAALPPRFPSTIAWRDPFTGRHAVPYPMTREWDSTRTWGCPPLHINTLTSLLVPWSGYTFPVRDYIGLPRPLSPSMLATAKRWPGPVASDLMRSMAAVESTKMVYRRPLSWRWARTWSAR